MKNLLKYISAGAVVAAIIFFFLMKDARKDNKIKDSAIYQLKQDSISVKAELNATKDFVNKLQNSKTKQETTFKEIKGRIIKTYNKELRKRDNLITRLKNKKPEYIIVKDSATDITTLSDRFKTSDLTLDYIAKYKGEFLGITFDYKVKQKIITVDHIIYEPKYIPKPYPVKRNYFQFIYNYVPSTTHNIHDFNVGYVTKFGVGFNTGGLLFDGEFYLKVGIVIQIPKK